MRGYSCMGCLAPLRRLCLTFTTYSASTSSAPQIPNASLLIFQLVTYSDKETHTPALHFPLCFFTSQNKTKEFFFYFLLVYYIYFCINKSEVGWGIQFIIRGGVILGLNPQHEICYKCILPNCWTECKSVMCQFFNRFSSLGSLCTSSPHVTSLTLCPWRPCSATSF